MSFVQIIISVFLPTCFLACFPPMWCFPFVNLSGLSFFFHSHQNTKAFQFSSFFYPIVHFFYTDFGYLSSMSNGCSQKGFKLVWRCHQLLSGFLSKGQLPWVLHQSRLSANTSNKGDNEMTPAAVLQSPGIYITSEENPRKPHLRDHLMKAVRLVISNGVSYLLITSWDRTVSQEIKRKAKWKKIYFIAISWHTTFF